MIGRGARPLLFIVQTTVFPDVPVSFNEIIVSAIVGAGVVAEGDATSAIKIRTIVAAWIGSLVLSGLCAYALVTLTPSA